MAQKTTSKKVTEKEIEIVDPTESGLSAHINRCYSEAKTAKAFIIERLLRCERQRRGIYDPEKVSLIRDTGGSDIYMMLTDIKCRAAESWIKDVMLSAGDKSWSLAPTKEPALPNELREGVIETVISEANAVAQQGMAISPLAIDARMEEIYHQVTQALKDQADNAAIRMENRMLDKLQDAKWSDTMREVIYDFVTFPTCFIKGPIVRKKRTLKWGKNWKPEVVEEIQEDFERVSPYDMFPSPNAVTCQDGYLIQRHKLTRASLQDLRGLPGYRTDEIDAALEQYGQSGLREIIQADSERNLLEGRNNTMVGTEIIEAIEFWGPVSGQMLIDWGMQDQSIDPYREYQVDAWRVGTHVIKAVLNPDPLGRRPYSKASWESIPGAFWGLALPEMMRDVQTMCNASARALAWMNAALGTARSSARRRAASRNCWLKSTPTPVSTAPARWSRCSPLAQHTSSSRVDGVHIRQDHLQIVADWLVPQLVAAKDVQRSTVTGGR